MTVDRQNAMTARNFQHVTAKNADKTPLRCRRNGQTKTWKKKPEDFQIPVKYGLYQHFYITNSNAHEWEVAD